MKKNTPVFHLSLNASGRNIQNTFEKVISSGLSAGNVIELGLYRYINFDFIGFFLMNRLSYYNCMLWGLFWDSSVLKVASVACSSLLSRQHPLFVTFLQYIGTSTSVRFQQNTEMSISSRFPKPPRSFQVLFLCQSSSHRSEKISSPFTFSPSSLLSLVFSLGYKMYVLSLPA